MNLPKTKCVAIMGATATGKSALGIWLARRFRGEIVSMDSRQVYRDMDVGTGKVPPGEQGGIAHHLFDILDPSETGSAGRHAGLARSAIVEIDGRGCVPFLVGGTGLYFDALFNPFVEVDIPREQVDSIRAGFASRDTLELYAELRRVDPARAKALSSNDRVRITRALEIYLATGKPMSEHLSQPPAVPGSGGELTFCKLVLTMPRDGLRRRIAQRTRTMYTSGWVDEVKRLLGQGYGTGSPGMRGLGYEEIAVALQSGTDPHGTIDDVITRTQQYAKRQETYFRKDKESEWLDVTDGDYRDRAASVVSDFLGGGPG
jgi:tRNA dimethylallyltransferase